MKKLLSTFILLFAILCANAQVTTLTFVGKDRTGQNYVQLDRVSVFNQTQLWHEVLYYPDTTLRLGAVDIEDYVENGFQLMQNVPNPFDGVTDFALSLPSGQDVQLEIYDVNGKKVAAQDYPSLSAGTHLFRATLSAPQTYLLSASTHEGKTSIKMINTGDGGGNGIVYLGMTNADGSFTIQLKGGRGTAPYPFSRGDLMQYTGYAVIDGTERVSDVVEKNQNNNETIALQFDVAKPAVATNACSNVMATSVAFNGEVTADNNAFVTERGFCYREGTETPTIADNTVTAGAGTGLFSAVATGLQPGKNYRVRAYAKNAVGLSYGLVKNFVSQDTLPVVTTTQPSGITATAFVGGGEVVETNCLGTAARGVCWNTTGQPTVADAHTSDGVGAGAFTSSVTGLDCNTTYYVRAYATNSAGTAYGEEIVVTTLASSAPRITTLTATISNCFEIVATAEVLSDNCAAVTARGFCYSTSPTPTLSDAYTTNGAGLGNYVDTLVGLEMATTYYVRAYATNSVGTAYGEELTVTTCDIPAVTTSAVTNITASSATCGGNVTTDGGTTVTARGVCWSTSQNPTVSNSHTANGTGTGSFTSNITGLTANTTYYVRAYATNSVGTSYGAQKSFTTPFSCGTSTLTDVEGNTYNTVAIGSQCWMKENLRTKKYADGTSISQGSTTSTTTGYWYYPNNSSSNQSTFGLLYNWKAVMRNSSSSTSNPSNVQGICPTGWHVPSVAEWTQLTNYVSSQSAYCCSGNTSYIAKALAGTTGWHSATITCAVGNSPSSNNATGFSALPAGDYPSSYYNFGAGADFWSATEGGSDNAVGRTLEYNGAGVYGLNGYKSAGYSVRCVKD